MNSDLNFNNRNAVELIDEGNESEFHRYKYTENTFY